MGREGRREKRRKRREDLGRQEMAGGRNGWYGREGRRRKRR